MKARIELNAAPAQAVETLQRLRTLVPREEALELELADALIAVERYDDALEIARPLTEGGNPLVLLRLGKALFAAGRTEEALEVLELAVQQADAIARADLFGADYHYCVERPVS